MSAGGDRRLARLDSSSEEEQRRALAIFREEVDDDRFALVVRKIYAEATADTPKKWAAELIVKYKLAPPSGSGSGGADLDPEKIRLQAKAFAAALREEAEKPPLTRLQRLSEGLNGGGLSEPPGAD